MILFPDLLQLPHQLRHPEVRDLAWVILAPPMLGVTTWPQRHPLTGSDWDGGLCGRRAGPRYMRHS